MKKLILFFCLLFSLSSFAQKTHYFDQIGFVAGGSLYKVQQFTDSIAFDNIFYSSAFRRKTVNNVSYVVPKWVNDKISYPGIKQYTHHYPPTKPTMLIYNPDDKIIYCQDEEGGGDPGIIIEDFAVRNIISYDSLGTNIPTVFGAITVRGSINAYDITLSDVAADQTPETLFSSSGGQIKTVPISSLPFAGSSHNHSGIYEGVLGNPSVTGYVLASTTAGVRSWIPQAAGSGGGATYYAGFGIGITGTTFYNLRYQKNIDTVKTTLNGLLFATAGVLSTISPDVYATPSWVTNNFAPKFLSGTYEPAITKSNGYAKWNGTAWSFSNETYLQSFTEVDPTYAASAAHGIDINNITAWNANNAKVTFPGMGTTHSLPAYGDHNHSGVYEPANSNIQTHISSTSNPHSVTKAQVGLGLVENTALSAWTGTANITTVGSLPQIISSTTTGTAPFVTSSTTLNTNFNADLVDGHHASEFSLISHNHDATYEAKLSNPSNSGMILSSTTAGVKSWVAPADVSGKVNIINGSFTGIYVLTQAQYDAIIVKDTMILYFIR